MPHGPDDRPKYCLWITPRGDGKDYPAHDSLSRHLQSAFLQLGYCVPIVRRRSELVGRPLVLAPHRILEHSRFLVPVDAILINTEHLFAPPRPWQRIYARILGQFEVWDFSPRNIAVLSTLGCRQVKLLELGAVSPNVAPTSRDVDIDVLFFGAMTDRRRKILSRLRNDGIRVTCLKAVFGAKLHEAIARSRLVVNVHREEGCVFEMIRMLDLLPRGRCVVSERGADPALEARFEDGVVFCTSKNLSEVVRACLADTDLQAQVGRRGKEIFEQVPQSEVLGRLLESVSSVRQYE